MKQGRCLASPVIKLTMAPSPVLVTKCDLLSELQPIPSGSLIVWNNNNNKLCFSPSGYPELPNHSESVQGYLGEKCSRNEAAATERNMGKKGNFHIYVSRRSIISEKPSSAASLFRRLDFKHCNCVTISGHICICYAMLSHFSRVRLCATP